jgi:tetratricopeptide (TPR) repeat protein/tRNA A-37 threonylcarbamoyl transferase component Bud32
MIGQLIQHYRILRKLGAGGMGVVYEAEDTRLGRHVALKFLPASLGLSPEASARFEREARMLSSLNHPNICTIHDLGTVADGGRERRFIVMERLEGESLRSRIHGQPLPVDLVVEVGSQIADALDAAHAKGIIHRDIKPANIFITKRGQAKLLDFGVAKPGGDQGPADEETRALAEQLTVPGTTVGSISYMSPEQARGQEVDGRTDLFSLGIVLYEMATGRQPFGGPTSAVVYDSILNRNPVPVCQVNADAPAELERVIMRALEKDPRLRYQTASDLVADLLRLRRDTELRRAGSSGSAPIAVTMPAVPAAPATVTTGAASVAGAAATAPAGTATVSTPRARPRWALVGVPAVLVLGVAGFWLWSSTRTPAFTERDLIVVADFVNSTGDAVFDDALKQAVSVQLQQTSFVTLLPDRQVQNTLALMQRKPDDAVTGAVARELCQRAGARATVEGSIAPLGSSYVIALGVHDCQSGAAIAQEQTQADTKEGVLKAVGGAVTALRKHLGESLASVQKNDVPAEATTASLEALQAYGLGVKTRVTKGDEASIPFFQQALERDPTFALAHAKLGVVFANLGRRDDAKRETQRAYELRDKVSEYERLYINWSYSARVEVDDAKQKQALEVLTTTYPRDFAGRNNFGAYYMGKGQFEDALAQFVAAHEIGPGEPLPMSNAAYSLFFLGRHDEAMKMAEQSLAVRPDRGLATARWVYAHIHRDAGETAARELATKLGSPDGILQVTQAMALWDGRMADFGTAQRQLIEMSRAAKKPDSVAALEQAELITRAIVMGGASLDALRQAIGSPTASRSTVAQGALMLAVKGDLSAVRREVARLEREPQPPTGPSDQLVTMRAYVQAADGRVDEAIAGLQGTLSTDLRRAATYFTLAQIQERAGRIDDAVASYRRVVAAAPALGMNMTVPIARLALARLLTGKGDAAGARVQFDELARQWAHADPDFTLAKELHTLAGG